MANEEHLALLRQGIEAWNAWRKKNRAELPELSGAELSGANLLGADFAEADLSEANLDMKAFHQEVMRIVLLDCQFRCITKMEISRGTVNESVAYPREILRPAITHQSFAFLLVDNHPCGESFDGAFPTMLAYGNFKFRTRKNSKQLTENAGKLSHERGSFRFLVEVFTPPNLTSAGTPFNFTLQSNRCFGQD